MPLLDSGTVPLVVAIGIAICTLAMVVGPFLSASAYSSVRHTTSELAGQAMPFAWVMRMGLLAYGLSALVLCVSGPERSLTGLVGLAVFGMCLIGTAIWSHKPIDPAAPFSAVEDRIHSLFASTMGLGFAMAVVARLFVQCVPTSDGLSWTALGASIVLPLGMAAAPRVAGLLQRMIFGASFVWILREAGAFG